MEQSKIGGVAHHRAIIAVDIEKSTFRTDPIKAELREKSYELFEMALRSAGIYSRHRDRLVDRGDGFLALVHPVRQAPKSILLGNVLPAFGRLLADHNASLPGIDHARQFRVRAVIHAGEVRYDSHGCFGEALDVAFRLLDDARIKKALLATSDPLVLVTSGDIYDSVVRHSYDQIGHQRFLPLGCVRVAGRPHQGWIQVSEKKPHLIDITRSRKSA
jgi:hypothetical protein